VEQASLPAACSTALIAVFAVLALLALVIRLVTLLFPARGAGEDAALVAAIAAAVASRHAGATVTGLVEVP
jgi:hypothetical protein